MRFEASYEGALNHLCFLVLLDHSCGYSYLRAREEIHQLVRGAKSE